MREKIIIKSKNGTKLFIKQRETKTKESDRDEL